MTRRARIPGAAGNLADTSCVLQAKGKRCLRLVCATRIRGRSAIDLEIVESLIHLTAQATTT